MRRVAGLASLLSTIWLSITLSFFVYSTIVPGAWIDDSTCVARSNACNFQYSALLGAFFAPLVPLIIFAFLHGKIQRSQLPSKVPAPLTLCALCIAIPLGLLAEIVRADTRFQTHAVVGQAVFATLGVWLALSSFRAIRQHWFSKTTALGGFFGGLGFASLVYFEILDAVNRHLAQTLGWLFLVIILTWIGGMVIWSAGLTIWLLFDTPFPVLWRRQRYD